MVQWIHFPDLFQTILLIFVSFVPFQFHSHLFKYNNNNSVHTPARHFYTPSLATVGHPAIVSQHLNNAYNILLLSSAQLGLFVKHRVFLIWPWTEIHSVSPVSYPLVSYITCPLLWSVGNPDVERRILFFGVLSSGITDLSPLCSYIKRIPIPAEVVLKSLCFMIGRLCFYSSNDETEKMSYF